MQGALAPTITMKLGASMHLNLYSLYITRIQNATATYDVYSPCETIKIDRLVWSSFEFNVPSLNTVDNIMVSNLQLRSINTTSVASCLSRVCHRFPATKA